MVQSTLKGRAVGAGTGDPTDLTSAQATAILNLFTSSLPGLVAASGGGTANFLRADGTFAAPAGGGGGITTVALLLFETNGTYTPTVGMKFCIAIGTGAGGGGGGADTPGVSGQVGVGGGGAAGSTCIELFSAATIGASQSVTVPNAGGAGGSGTNGATGTSGVDTIFGAGPLFSALGGGGGLGSTIVAAIFSARTGGSPTVSPTGLINLLGGGGEGGIGFSVDGTTDICFGKGGDGGASFWGGGGRGAIAAQTSLTADQQILGGNAGRYGGGGGGAICLTSSTGVAGGNGGPGVLVILEFI